MDKDTRIGLIIFVVTVIFLMLATWHFTKSHYVNGITHAIASRQTQEIDIFRIERKDGLSVISVKGE